MSTRNARRTIVTAPMAESKFLEKREVVTRLREGSTSNPSDMIRTAEGEDSVDMDELSPMISSDVNNYSKKP